jgi:Nif11 domain
MSLQTAIQFIQQVRRDAMLKRQLEALGLEATLESVVALGAVVGCIFTAEELQRAYKHDWGMRWAHYYAQGNTSN